MKMYKLLADLDYSPTGKHYPKGAETTLEGWSNQHIANAIRAKQVEEKKGAEKWSDK